MPMTTTTNTTSMRELANLPVRPPRGKTEGYTLGTPHNVLVRKLMKAARDRNWTARAHKLCTFRQGADLAGTIVIDDCGVGLPHGMTPALTVIASNDQRQRMQLFAGAVSKTFGYCCGELLLTREEPDRDTLLRSLPDGLIDWHELVAGIPAEIRQLEEQKWELTDQLLLINQAIDVGALPGWKTVGSIRETMPTSAGPVDGWSYYKVMADVLCNLSPLKQPIRLTKLREAMLNWDGWF